MIRSLALAPLILLAACSMGGGGGSATSHNALTPVEPDTGTAPDWQVNCVERARREFNVGYEAIQMQGPTIMPDGSRTAEGLADRSGTSVRFRCSTMPQGRISEFVVLPSGEGAIGGGGNRQ